MRFLLHGTITPAAADAIVRHGHSAQTLEQAGLAADLGTDELVKAAHKKQLELVTADKSIVEWIYASGARVQRTVVYLQLAGGDVEQDDAIDRLFERYKRLTPGRLYTLTETRVKVRQLPTGTGRPPSVTDE
jgi:hypothetical protein